MSDVDRYAAQIVDACRAGRMPGAALSNLINAAKRERTEEITKWLRMVGQGAQHGWPDKAADAIEKYFEEGGP